MRIVLKIMIAILMAESSVNNILTQPIQLPYLESKKKIYPHCFILEKEQFIPVPCK